MSAKNFSTAALATTLLMWGLSALDQGQSAHAQSAAVPVAPAKTTTVFVANAPDEYTVVRGDTLWGIAGRFLTNPLRWPQIWQMNRSQIRNPHWIYPGQVIVIDKVNGTMHLRGSTTSDGTVVLHPAIRVEDESTAIPSIPQSAIEPFLTQPLLVEDDTMRSYPRIVGAKGDRVILGRSDIAYVEGITDPSITAYQIFEPGEQIKDPDTGKVIGHQASYLGTAQVVRGGNPATVQITSFAEEIGIGARLVPATRPLLINYVPHAPDHPVKGRIVLVYGGIGDTAGRNSVVAVNLGSDDGIEMGNVLAVWTHGAKIDDKTNGSTVKIQLPDENNGLAFVFRTFHHISYALLLRADVPVYTGDVVMQP